MQANNPSATLAQTPTFGQRLRNLLRNALRMMAVWSAIGVLSGLLSAPQPRTVISVIAGVIAGVIVFAPVGAMLSLFAARRAEVLLAALLGLGIGAGVAVCAGWSDILASANQGMVMGGLFGSTFIPVFYRLPGFVMRLIRRLTKQPELASPSGK